MSRSHRRRGGIEEAPCPLIFGLSAAAPVSAMVNACAVGTVRWLAVLEVESGAIPHAGDRLTPARVRPLSTR